LTITQDSLILQGLTIPLRIQKGKRRRMVMTFSKDALLVETTSGVLSEIDTDFMRKNSAWILRNYQRQSGSWKFHQQFLENITHKTMIFGREVQVQFEVATQYSYHYKESLLVIRAPQISADRKRILIAAVLRKIASVYLQKCMNHWIEITLLKINTLKVKNHRSKWGSCSSLGNINLNWHLVMVERSLADYVIVHELMHLKEMNHSPAFWKLVEQFYPNYRAARKALGERQWIIGVYS
jgi:predicted metal-dependent hydrolase